MSKVYHENYFDQQGDTLADIWSAVGSIGAAGVSLLPSLFGGGGSAAGGPARGLAAINAFGSQAIQTLNQILSQLNGRQLSPADAITNAERIVAALSNPAMVYQAQRGNDADALRNFKAQANAILERIRAAAGIPIAGNANAPATSPAAVSGNAAGVSSPPVQTSGELSISPTVLMIVAAAVGGLLLLKR